MFYPSYRRAQAVAVAQAVLLGRLDVLRAARRLVGFRDEFDEMKDDEAFWTVVAIDSETDHLPLGPEREHWNAEALARKDEEIARAIAHWDAEGRAACERIIDRLGPSVYGAA